eukprot:jgi/Mesvir1/25049/Mv04487-RA.1
MLTALGLPYQFCRLQSTLCEAAARGGLEKLLLELDPNLLLSLALGHTCFIYDYGSRNKKRGVPRSIWYGVEFVRFALHTLWFDAPPPHAPILRGHDVTAHFQRQVASLSKSTTKRLRYYRKWIPVSPSGVEGDAGSRRVRVFGICSTTWNDGEHGYYRDILYRHAGIACLAQESGLVTPSHGATSHSALDLLAPGSPKQAAMMVAGDSTAGPTDPPVDAVDISTVGGFLKALQEQYGMECFVSMPNGPTKREVSPSPGLTGA